MRCRAKALSLFLLCIILITSSTCTTREIYNEALLSDPAVAAEPIGAQSEDNMSAADPEPDASQPPETDPPPESEAEPDPEPEEEQEPEPLVFNARLAVVGDLMAHQSQLDHAYDRATGTYSFTSVFEEIRPYLEDADYTIGNLETTLAGAEAGFGGYPMFNTPDAYAEALKEAGFDLLSTANNHANDKREAGIIRTIETLRSLGFDQVGTYATQEEQEQIFFKEINNIRFAFLAYSYSNNGIPLTSGKPYLLNMLDENLMRRQIEQARQEGAEVIVVLPHMGDEYAERPSSHFTTLARNLCRYGADVIMASHPHVLQPTEVFEVEDEDGTIRTCFIAYSMGNFVSGQRIVPREVGGVFYLDFEKIVDENGSSVRITHTSYAPTWVQFQNTRWEPEIKVLPVADTIWAHDAGADLNLAPYDISRLREVHRLTSIKMLGYEVPADEMSAVYTLFCELEEAEE